MNSVRLASSCLKPTMTLCTSPADRQKYRTNRERSRQEFRLYHEEFLKKLLRDHLSSEVRSSSNPGIGADLLEDRMVKMEWKIVEEKSLKKCNALLKATLDEFAHIQQQLFSSLDGTIWPKMRVIVIRTSGKLSYGATTAYSTATLFESVISIYCLEFHLMFNPEALIVR